MATKAVPAEIQLGYGIRANLKGAIDKILCLGYSYSQNEYAYCFNTYSPDKPHGRTHSFRIKFIPQQLTEGYILDVCHDIIQKIKQDRGLT